MTDFLENLFGGEAPSGNIDEPDIIEPPQQTQTGVRSVYPKWESNLAAITGPVGAKGMQGLLGLADIGRAGINLALPESWQIPNLGETLASEIYSPEMERTVNQNADLWARRVGNDLATPIEWLTGGLGGSSALKGLGRLTSKVPLLKTWIPKLAEYGSKAQKADLAIGANISAAGELADAIGGPEAEQTTEKYLSIAPLGYTALRTALAAPGHALRKAAQIFDPSVEKVIVETPDMLAASMQAENRAGATNVVTGNVDPLKQEALDYATLKNLEDKLDNQVTGKRIAGIEYDETKALKQQMQTGTPAYDQHEIGTNVQDELMIHKSVKEADLQQELDAIDMDETIDDATKLILKDAVKEKRLSMRSTTGSDAQDLKYAMRNLYQMATGKGAFSAKKAPLTVGDMRDAKQNLQTVMEQSSGKAKKVAGELLEQIRNDMSPDELKKWWAHFKEKAQVFDNVETNIVAELTETHPGVNVDPHDPDSAFMPVKKGREVFDRLKNATKEEIGQLTDVLGEPRTKQILVAVHKADMAEKMERFAEGAPKGTAGRDLAAFRKSLEEQAGKWKDIYGAQGYADIITRIKKLKRLSDVRELAHSYRGESVVKAPNFSDIPGSRAGIGAKMPQIPGLPVSGFSYFHPEELVRGMLKKKALTANRILYNQLAPKFPGSLQSLPAQYEPGFLEGMLKMSIPEEAQFAARQAGTYANMMADTIDPDSGMLMSQAALPASAGDLDEMFAGTESGFVEDKKKDPIGSKMAASEEARAKAERIAAAQIQVESAGNPSAVSKKGAVGLMQLKGLAKIDAAKSLGLDPDTLDLFDPEDNVRLGKEYLAMQIDRFKDEDLALAAYNAGPTAVREFLRLAKKRGLPQNWESVKKLMKPHEGYQETIAYVRKLGEGNA